MSGDKVPCVAASEYCERDLLDDDAECCDDGFVYTATGFLELQPGQSVRTESICGCRNSEDDVATGPPATSDRIGFATQIAVFWALVVVFLFLCQRTSRCRNTGRRRYESAPREETARVESEMVAKTDRAKAGLVAATAVAESHCSICLCAFDDEPGDAALDEVVRPHACRHTYHRTCIEEWIDQAKSKSVIDRERDVRDQLAKRMLSCPICAAPFDAPTEETKHDLEMIVLSTSYEDVPV
mmetsp:Transcript_19605/g.61650  ORF Transcript_19605/g.61650 Transcript_19605/m.61650 type:complete len:241 (-) Transcript_19605:387-1109(-)